MKSFLEMLGEAEQNPQFMKDKASVEVQPSSKGDSPVKKKTSKDLPKNKTIGGDTPNKIEIEPEYITRMDGMKESVQRTVVFSFGRMNPPTVGHQKLVDKIVSVAKKNNGDAKVFLSRTEGNAKNPIPYSKKIKFAKIAFPGVVQDTPKTMLPAGFIGILKTLEDKYDNAIIVVGSDRIPETQRIASKYNGTEYNFKSIEVVSAGERDPDEEGVGGMSASKMRAAVASGDFDSFKGGLPAKLRGLAKTVYDAVSETISESLDEAVLTTSQRLKRRAQMRRFKGKIRMGQKRAIRRKATNVTIKKRSRRIAIKLMRKRILRGRNYNDLSLSSRQSVDRIVARRKAAIGRIAKRVEPKLRQAESRRKAGTGYKSISLGAPPSKKKKLKESLLVDWSGNNIIPSVTDLLDRIAEETSIRLTMLEHASLMKKSRESGESLDTIRQVFDRGVAAWHAGLREGSTPQQWGFARVNSFIHNGYSARTADFDLVEHHNLIEDSSESGENEHHIEIEFDKDGTYKVAHYSPKKLNESSDDVLEQDEFHKVLSKFTPSRLDHNTIQKELHQHLAKHGLYSHSDRHPLIRNPQENKHLVDWSRVTAHKEAKHVGWHSDTTGNPETTKGNHHVAVWSTQHPTHVRDAELGKHGFDANGRPKQRPGGTKAEHGGGKVEHEDGHVVVFNDVRAQHKASDNENSHDRWFARIHNVRKIPKEGLIIPSTKGNITHGNDIDSYVNAKKSTRDRPKEAVTNWLAKNENHKAYKAALAHAKDNGLYDEEAVAAKKTKLGIDQKDSEKGKHETIANIANKEVSSKSISGHLKNSDPEIADAARKALEKRRDAGDKEAGKHMDKAEAEIQASQKPAPLAVPSAARMGLSTAKALLKARGAKVPTFEAFCEATKVPAGPNAGLGNEPTVNAKPVHHKSSVHKFHMHHMTNPNLPLKHQIKHAEDRKDIDVDGDTDAFDKPNSGVPDEVPVPTAKTNRAFLKKYAKEHEHTHAGEPVDESDHKYTTNEDDWYLDAAGNKVRVMHNSDLKEPEDVAKYLRDKNKDDNFGKVMSMKDFLKTQPDKKVKE